MVTQNSQEQLRSAITEFSKSPTQFLQLCGEVISSARQAGVSEQQILDQIHSWYENRSGGTQSQGSQSGGTSR